MQKAKVEIVCQGSKEFPHDKAFIVKAFVNEGDPKTVRLANMVSYPTYDSKTKTTSQKTIGSGRPDYENKRIILDCKEEIKRGVPCKFNLIIKDDSEARKIFDEFILEHLSEAVTRPAKKDVVTLSDIEGRLKQAS